MANRRKIVAVLLGVSLICLLGLYAHAWSMSPRDARIGDLGQDDIGAFVRTQGHVRSVTTVGSGGVRVELLDYMDRSSISVYLSRNAFRSLDFSGDVRPGALLELAGEVEAFNGEVELFVQDGGFVKLLAGAEENRIGLGTLANNPETFAGMTVVVQGVAGSLGSVIDWSKMLAVAGSDRIWVDKAGGGRFGGVVDIFGKVLLNEARSRFEIKVAGGSDSIAPHGQAPPSGYEEVPLNILAGDPERWEGNSVAVIGVRVISGEIIGTSFTLADFEDGDSYVVSCIVFGWDWSTDRRGIDNETTVEFIGTWGYYSANAQWQVTSNQFTLRI